MYIPADLSTLRHNLELFMVDIYSFESDMKEGICLRIVGRSPVSDSDSFVLAAVWLA